MSTRVAMHVLSRHQRNINMAARVCTRNFHHSSPTLNKKTALVLGSSGVLGSTVAKYLSRQEHMNVIGADVVELPNLSDFEVDDFVPLPHFGQHPTLGELTERLAKGVDYSLSNNTGNNELSAIVVASGGWQLDPTPDADATHFELQQGARVYGDAMETMLRMNLYPVAAAGYIAQEYMGPEGLFVVMGATAALQPTPGMIGYGVSKSAAHQYVQTLGATTGLAVAPKTLRKEGRKARRHYQSLDTLSVVGILPTMLDTPSNREANPDTNFDECTKPMEIAKEIGTWISTPPLRPHSGSLVKVFTNNEGTHFQLVR